MYGMKTFFTPYLEIMDHDFSERQDCALNTIPL